MEEFHVDSVAGHSSTEEVLQKLLISEGKEALKGLVRLSLIVGLGEQQEAILISLQHLLILRVLKELSHQLSHHDLILLDAII